MNTQSCVHSDKHTAKMIITLYRLLNRNISQSETWRRTTEMCLRTLLRIVCDIKTIKG